MNNSSYDTTNIARRGLMLVLSSPSGAGKTSLAKKILEDDQQISMSVSMTTRPPRPGEVEGTDYIFVEKEEFDSAINNNELLEWAEVFENLYGTPSREIYKKLEQGQDVLFDIDWQGTQQLHEKARHDLVRVFILPPNVKELEKRLKGRGQDNEQTVTSRMRDAANQISHWAEYDYIIINENLDQSLTELKSILAAERIKRERLIGLSEFVRDMTAKM